MALTASNPSIGSNYPSGIPLYSFPANAAMSKLPRAGEYKRLSVQFTSSISLNSHTILFSPALFFNQSASSPYNSPIDPVENWSFVNDASSTVGTYNMFCNASFPTTNDLLRNFTATIQIISSTQFIISLLYYQGCDVEGYMQSGLINNHVKLLKDKVSSSTELNVSGNSVYTQSGYGAIFFVKTEDLSITNGSTKQSINYKFTDYEAGFYGKNNLNTSPYFTNPVWEFYDPSNNSVGTILGAQNTLVRFKIDSATNIYKIFAWLIRTDKFDNTVDMLTNYDKSFIDVVTAISGTLDNKLISPSLAPVLVSGTTYKCEFTIDYTTLVQGEKYRLIAIVYDDFNEGTPQHCNSFISEEYTISKVNQFDGNGYNITGSLKDYQQEFTGNDLTCIVEERLKGSVNIDYSSNAFSNDMLNRLGLTVANDIKRYLTKMTVLVYEDLGTTRQIFEQQQIVKIDPINYSTNNKISANFTTNNVSLTYDFRVRYESWFQNLQTLIGGVPLVTPSANQNWAGRDLRIEYQFELFYDDYVSPFSDIIKFIQKLTPKDYSNDVIIYEENGNILTGNEYYCNTDEACFKALLNVSPQEEYKLITNVELSPGDSNLIEENEVWGAVIDLPKLNTNKILTQEEQYSETETNYSKFCINALNFYVNLPYKISAIAKKQYVAPIIPVDGRITEDGILRDLETTDFRIIE